MATVPSLRVVKSMPFKGGSRLWSNRYHFTGGTPADATHWHTLMDNVVTAEKAIYLAGVVIVEAFGYAAGSDVSVAEKAYSTAGTLTPVAGAVRTAGESAALLRFSTAAVSTKNHPIYLFNYFHGACVPNSSTLNDQLDTNQKSAIETYAGSWITGFSDGTITAHRAGPTGHVATGHVTEEWVTHRDFPYTRSL